MADIDVSIRLAQRALPDILNAYRGHINHGDFAWGAFSEFTLTPEKPNTARTTIPLVYKGEERATMNAIVFAPGNGTGDTSTYQLLDLPIHERSYARERVIPRKKVCAMEIFFPLLTITENRAKTHTLHPHLASLEELSIDEERNVVKLWDLGEPREFRPSPNSIQPQLQFTTGHYPSGKRFGDPHSIFYNPQVAEAFATPPIQVVGFVAIDAAQNPLAEIFDRIRPLPEQGRY